MEDVTRMVFGLLGVVAALLLVFIDRRFPWDSPINNRVYRIIGGYILFVFAWPKAVSRSLWKVTDKIVEKFISKKQQ